MSKFLNEIISNNITLEEGLQRLLIIANKVNNNELIKWCNFELNGYDKYELLPEYRKIKCKNIVYSGINGGFQVTNIPIGPNFLSEKRLSEIENVGIFENVAKIEENKNIKEMIYLDLTILAGEVYKNSNDGFTAVSCTSIRQVIPSAAYSSVYSNVKTRVINLLCSFEIAKIDIDKLDISKAVKVRIIPQNTEIYNSIVLNGEPYIVKKDHRIMWNIIVPIITAIVAGVSVFLITSMWFKV